MENERHRSQILLDIEHDLNRIKNRLNALEDHFEQDGMVSQIAQAIHQLAVKIEQLSQVGDASAE